MKKSRRPPVFEWEGIAPDGKKISGLISAPSTGRAQNSLLRHHIRILSIRKKKQPLLLFQRPFSGERQAVFFSQLATLLAAGIPILQALAMTCGGSNQNTWSVVHTALRETILAGHGLAGGLEHFPQYFDALTCHLIRAGEKTGTLDTLLARIAAHKEKMGTLKRHLIRASFHPLITLFIACVITLFMLMVMTPRFAAIFADMHIPLPGMTRAVLGLGNMLRRFFLPGIIFCVIIVVSMISIGNRLPAGFMRDNICQQLPGLRTLFKKSISVRFTRTLATLLSAGIPMAEALGMTAPIAGSERAAKVIRAFQQDVHSGRQLCEAMRNHPFFSPLIQQMVQAGEESGTLPKMLEKISGFLEAEVEHTAGLICRLFEPLIMVILGVVIGALVVAMYLPIFKLGNVT